MCCGGKISSIIFKKNLKSKEQTMLYHLILDVIWSEHIRSIFREIIISAKHEDNLSKECEASGGPHIHVVGHVKFSKRSLRDGSQEWFNNQSTGGKEFRRYLIDQCTWKVLKSQAHIQNSIKYVKKYNVEIDNSEKFEQSVESESVVDKLIKNLIVQPLEDEEYKKFRAAFPNEKAWKHKLLSQGRSKRCWAQFQHLEKRAKVNEQNSKLTDEQLKVVMSIRDLSFMHLIHKFKQELTPKKEFGKIIILFGEAKSFKSTMVTILGNIFGGATTMPGSQFIQPDNLKWDSHVKSGNKNLIVEEMKWYDISKKISIKDTLHKLKELYSGGELNIRVAKNTECSDLSMKLQFTFLTSNTYRTEGITYENICLYLDQDQSLKRRIECHYIPSSDTKQWEQLVQKYGYATLLQWITKYWNTEDDILIGRAHV